jgi:hypothetical protein
MNKTHVLVEVETLEEFKENALFLEALRAAGVDNWDGYDYAVTIYQELQEMDVWH